MTKKPTTSKDAADKVVKNIRRKTRQTYSSEEKIRIVLAGLRGEESIAVLCRREGIAESLYYSWSKEFLEAGKIGDSLTLVGFGRSGSGCVDPFGTKREITLPLWGIYEPNPTMQIGTREMGSCPGDSGGPALNENGKIVGVSSTAPGNYDSTHVAANFLAGFRDLGGTIVGNPTAVHTGNGRVEVFVRGARNNDLVQRSWNGRSWSGWKNLGGDLADSPVAVHVGDGKLEVFVRGAHNNELVQRSWNGKSWSGWKNLGGDIKSNPNAVHTGNGRIEVFVRGAHNDELVQRSWNGRGWSGWKNLGGDLADAPSAVHTGDDRIEVFVRGEHNDELVQRSWNGRSWSGWKNLRGDIKSSPTAVHVGNGHIDVFVRGAHNNELVKRSWNGRNWSGWKNLGGDLADAPSALRLDSGEIHIYSVGQLKELLQLIR